MMIFKSQNLKKKKRRLPAFGAVKAFGHGDVFHQLAGPATSRLGVWGRSLGPLGGASMTMAF